MELVKAITKDTFKWDIAALLSLGLVIVGLKLLVDNIRTWPIAGILIVLGSIFAIVFYSGPKLKREGKLSMSFLNSFSSKLLQKQTIISIPLSVDGAILGYEKKKSIVRRLKGYPSGIDTWEKFLETASFLNKNGMLTLMDLNTKQTAVLKHKEVNQQRMLSSKKPENRRKMTNYVDAMDEIASVLGTNGIAIETYEGPIPENNLSQYGNIESEEIDAKTFLNVLRGMPMALNALAKKTTSSVSKAVSTAFEFVGGSEPSIGHRYFKFVRVTDFDPTMGFKELIDICRRKYAEPVITLKSITPKEALGILEKQRNKQIVKQEIADSGTDGKSGQAHDEENERLKKIREFEKRIRAGEHTYKVFLKIRCVRNNTTDLSDDVAALVQELELHGYEAVVPENQDDMFKEMVTMDPGDEIFGFHMLAKELASVIMPLVKKSQMFAEPEGFAFGIADYGERVMKDIVKLLSGGIGLIIGLTGTGKSYLMAGMAYFMSFIGYRVVIFDPKGKGLKDVSFARLLSSVEGAVAVSCESLNVFDMFESIETQKTYQRGVLPILFKEISNDLVDIICQKANEFREKGVVPTFEILKKSFKEDEERLEEGQQTTDFVQSIRKENISLKNLRNVLAYINPLTNQERAKWFRTTPNGLRYPSDPEIAANGFIGIDFSLVDDEFAKRAMMNVVLFQMQVQMLQKVKVPTLLFIDELHDVVAKNEQLGNPTSEEIVKKLANEGRSHKMIAIGAAQMIKTLIATDAGNYAFENSSWIVQLGRPDSEKALRDNGADDDDIAYLRALTENEVGSGLLIVKGEKPLQFQVDFASYIHNWITGKTKPVKSDKNLGRVLRFESFEKKHHRSLINTMKYRSVRHKDLDGERCDFLVQKAEDPEMTIDLFLVEDYFKKQGIEVKADYESGLIGVNGDRTLLYMQPYNGNTPDAVELVKHLDKETDNWYIVYHSKNFVSPIATDALKSRLIVREDIPMSVEKIINR